MPSWSATFVRLYISHVLGAKAIYSSAAKTHKDVQDLYLHPQSYAPPTTLGADIIIERIDVNEWPLYRVSASPTQPTKKHTDAIMYFHGGAFYREIDPLHWKFIAQLARESGLDVLVPIYPLLPRPTATAQNIIKTVLQTVTLLPCHVVGFAGDSAGGHLALAAAQYMLRNEPSLASRLRFVVLISPVLDISLSHPEVVELEKVDPFLCHTGLKAITHLWTAGLSVADPLASPLFGELEGLPPVLVLAGTSDMLCADARRLSARFRHGGDGEVGVAGSVELDGFRYVEEEGMIHVYPLLPCWEGEVARKTIFEWVVKQLK